MVTACTCKHEVYAHRFDGHGACVRLRCHCERYAAVEICVSCGATAPADNMRHELVGPCCPACS